MPLHHLTEMPVVFYRSASGAEPVSVRSETCCLKPRTKEDVIPAKAGIQGHKNQRLSPIPWIPACAGMTRFFLNLFVFKTEVLGQTLREWLRKLPEKDRRKIGFDLATVQMGWPVGMPLCKSLGDGLWEIRSALPSRRIARVLFCVHKGRIGLVHGFIKKTQKTPASELELARKRMEEMLS